MKGMFLLALVLANFVPAFAKDTKKDANIDSLVRSMSLDEKIGQMVQIELDILTVPHASPIQVDTNKLREAILTYKVGSILNTGIGHALPIEDWHRVIKMIQDTAAETPHKIPVLYGIDSIHGMAYAQGSTLFPQHMAMAATRNPALLAEESHISAMETRAAGIRWTFAPVLDVGRQPLWSRFPETLGEDPYLAGVMGAAEIHGFQGDNLRSPTSVAACMKHYVGYSFPFNGHDRTLALIPDPYLREYFLPSFTAAVKSGVKTVMVDSGQVNGIPVHASKYLLTDVLRKELGFQGMVVSDWQDVIRLNGMHHVAATPKDAVELAVNAGLDMSMVPADYSFFVLLKQLVKEGKISERRIDQSVRHILELKKELGLFPNPYTEPEAVKNFGKPEYRQVALQAAEEAMTLLKNENNLLPLAKDRKVLVTGPTADSIPALNGCWSYTWQGTDPNWYPKHEPTIADAIRTEIGGGNVVFHAGVEFDGKAVDVDAAVDAAKSCDAVVLCLGENSYAEEPGDINDLDLPLGQLNFAKQLYATGKPVVLVLVEGRGRIIREIVPDASAILMAYIPGSEGATAIARTLFGDVNPSGKLPFTYNRYPNNFLTYDRNYTYGKTKKADDSPQFEFGAGLSYTTFEFKNPRLSTSVLKGKGRLTASVDLTNIGQREGRKAVELYTHDLYASLSPPAKRLRGFQKVDLQPGETKTITFEISAADLAFVNAQSKWVTEPGDFEVEIGSFRLGFRYER